MVFGVDQLPMQFRASKTAIMFSGFLARWTWSGEMPTSNGMSIEPERHAFSAKKASIALPGGDRFVDVEW
jgi:hypothetical protein